MRDGVRPGEEALASVISVGWRGDCGRASKAGVSVDGHIHARGAVSHVRGAATGTVQFAPCLFTVNACCPEARWIGSLAVSPANSCVYGGRYAVNSGFADVFIFGCGLRPFLGSAACSTRPQCLWARGSHPGRCRWRVVVQERLEVAFTTVAGAPTDCVERREGGRPVRLAVGAVAVTRLHLIFSRGVDDHNRNESSRRPSLRRCVVNRLPDRGDVETASYVITDCAVPIVIRDLATFTPCLSLGASRQAEAPAGIGL